MSRHKQHSGAQESAKRDAEQRTLKRQVESTLVLAGVVALNYAAQVPYYLHQYYLPHHQPPSPVGIVLLGMTLLWFVIGYSRFVMRKSYGFGILLGFLLTQVVFYGHAVVLGILAGAGAEAQLKTHSRFLLVIFSIGYVNFLVAAYYVYWLLRRGRRAQIA